METSLLPSAAAWPGVALVAYFVLGLPVYLVRVAVGGSIRDENLEGRPTTAILGLWVRLYFVWLMKPLFSALRALDIPANAITTLSTLLATGSGVALAAGSFSLGGWLMVFGGIADALDGRLARIRQESSKAGAALDSVLDRYSDAVVVAGLAWYYRDTWVLVPVLVLLISSLMVSYTRAKAEGFGVDVKGGLAQRAERIVILGAGLVFGPPMERAWFVVTERPIYWLSVASICLLAVMATWTALYRLAALHNKLGGNLFQGAGGAGRGSLVRHTASALGATGADFALVWALVSMLSMPAWAATALGCVLGGLVNFSINRVWTFGSKGDLGAQSGRYIMVSASSAALNAGGVALLLLPDLGLDYKVAWVVTRFLVFVAWNYPLQKTWVFSKAGSAAAALLVVSGGLVSVPEIAHAQALKPNVLDDGDFSESWTAIADLEDGTYVQVQLAISNIGPGDRNGVCRVLVAEPGKKAWSQAITVDSDEWSYKKGTLKIGACSAKASGNLEIRAPLGGGKATLVLASKPSRFRPPGYKLTPGDDFYQSEIMVPNASASVALTLPGQKTRKLSGQGYADHTRSTALPDQLAQRWVRVRALRAANPLLLLGRRPVGGGGWQGWAWQPGKEPVKLASFSLKGHTKAWTVNYSAGALRGTVTTSKQLFRHAPVEDHGWIGSVVGAVVGNPVTYTYRGRLDQANSPAIVEVSFVDE